MLRSAGLAVRWRRHRAFLVLVVTIVTLAVGAALSGAAADGAVLRRDAESMRQKVEAIRSRGELPARQRAQTTVSEKELNAYLTFELGSTLPDGVVEPTVSLLGDNRVAGRAVVDLDRVGQSRRSTSLFDPLSFVSGRMPVELTGRVTSAAGTGTFAFESASLGGAPVPKLVLQQLLSYYSRSPERPSGISLDDAFMLPASIQEIRLERGQAIVVQ